MIEILNFVIEVEDDAMNHNFLFEGIMYDSKSQEAKTAYEAFAKFVNLKEKQKEVSVRCGYNIENKYFQVKKVNNNASSLNELKIDVLLENESIENYVYKHGYEIVRELEFGTHPKVK